MSSDEDEDDEYQAVLPALQFFASLRPTLLPTVPEPILGHSTIIRLRLLMSNQRAISIMSASIPAPSGLIPTFRIGTPQSVLELRGCVDVIRSHITANEGILFSRRGPHPHGIFLIWMGDLPELLGNGDWNLRRMEESFNGHLEISRQRYRSSNEVLMTVAGPLNHFADFVVRTCRNRAPDHDQFQP